MRHSKDKSGDSWYPDDLCTSEAYRGHCLTHLSDTDDLGKVRQRTGTRRSRDQAGVSFTSGGVGVPATLVVVFNIQTLFFTFLFNLQAMSRTSIAVTGPTHVECWAAEPHRSEDGVAAKRWWKAVHVLVPRPCPRLLRPGRDCELSRAVQTPGPVSQWGKRPAAAGWTMSE